MDTTKPPYADLKKTPPAPEKPAVARREVQPGEQDDLLSHYNDLAAKMGVDNPPMLMVSEGYISEGGDKPGQEIVASEKLLHDLTAAERLAFLAYALGREMQLRAGEVFPSMEECQADAVFKALLGSGSRDAVMSMLAKMAQAKTEHTTFALNMMAQNATLDYADSAHASSHSYRELGTIATNPAVAARRSEAPPPAKKLATKPTTPGTPHPDDAPM